MKDMWPRVTDRGPTCAVVSFQMGHPGTTPRLALGSPRNCNSSRKEDVLNLQTREGGRKAGRQDLACQEGPGPTVSGRDQTIGISTEPVT